MTSPVQEELQEETLSPTQIAIAATAVYASLRASMVQQLLTLWYSLGSYGLDTLDEFLELVIPLVEASREASVETTLSYMALQLESLGLDLGATPDLSDLNIRNGVSVEEVYGRPHKVVWTKLSEGVPFDLARDYGAERVRQLAETDLQLSHTNTSRRLLADRNDIVGFRRVPTGDYTCALCLIASTQRYRKFDLMPIHPGCDCRVAPIVSDEPTDQVIDRDLLESLHTAVEDMFGFSDRSGRKVDYRKLLVVKDHGEYGPTLAKSGNKFTKLVLPE